MDIKARYKIITSNKKYQSLSLFEVEKLSTRCSNGEPGGHLRQNQEPTMTRISKTFKKLWTKEIVYCEESNWPSVLKMPTPGHNKLIQTISNFNKITSSVILRKMTQNHLITAIDADNIWEKEFLIVSSKNKFWNFDFICSWIFWMNRSTWYFNVRKNTVLQ